MGQSPHTSEVTLPQRTRLNLPLTKGKLGSDASFAEGDAPKRYTSYEDRYVAFIDILGFKNLIALSANPDSEADVIGRIVDALNIDFRGLESDWPKIGFAEADVCDLRIHTFSDFVVASTVTSPEALSLLLAVIWRLTSDWLSKGLLSRGGITRGRLVHKTEGGGPAIVFGPAFVEAYTLESQIADFPRVVLGKRVRQDALALPDDAAIHASKLFHKCDDGPYCIDIFAHLRKDGFKMFGDSHAEEAAQFQESITRQLDDTAESPALYRKVRWLAQRFNKAVDRTNYAGLLIDMD